MVSNDRFHIAIPSIHKLWQRIVHQLSCWQFSRKKRLAFLEDLASLVEDNVSLTQSLDAIYAASEGALRVVAKHVIDVLARGQLLADGLSRWLPRPTIEVIRAGEASGTLPKALRAAAESYRQQSHLLSGLLNAILYPLAVLVLALIVTVFVRHSVLTSFVRIMPLAHWPDIGRNLYVFAGIVQNAWWLFSLLIVAFIIFIHYALRNYTGKLRDGLDKLPIFSLYRQVVAARFMQTLGMLMENGVVIRQALSLLHQDAEPYLSWHILQMEQQLSGGQENIADILSTKLINRSDLIRLKVLARAKGFANALMKLGRQANQRNVQLTVLMSKLAGGLLLTLGAVIAATIIIGVYTVGSSLAS